MNAPTDMTAVPDHLAFSPWSTEWSGARRALPAVALIGVCVGAGLSPAGDGEGPVLCPYRFVTGGWCPGCGGTRAVRSLVRADVASAASLNPWAVLVLVQAAMLAITLAAAPSVARSVWQRHGNAILVVNATIAVLAWLARMATGAIPTPF